MTELPLGFSRDHKRSWWWRCMVERNAPGRVQEEGKRWVAPEFRGFPSWLLLPDWALLPVWPQFPGSLRPAHSDSQMGPDRPQGAWPLYYIRNIIQTSHHGPPWPSGTRLPTRVSTLTSLCPGGLSPSPFLASFFSSFVFGLPCCLQSLGNTSPTFVPSFGTHLSPQTQH